MVGRLLVLILFFFYGGLFPLFAQNTGSPLIRNYSSKDYQASLSNWDVTQGKDGHIYAANVEGILTFDSKNWNLTPTSSAALNLECTVNNRLFYGTFSDFGYISVNKQGELIMQSFAKKYFPKIEVGPIWSIKSCNGNVFFFSKKRIYKWNGTEIKFFDAKSDEFKYNLVCLNDYIYFLQDNHGLSYIKNDSIYLLNGTKLLADGNLLSLSKHDKILKILMKKIGLFELSTYHLDLRKKSSNYLQEIPLFNIEGLQKNSGFAIATSLNGIVVTDTAYNKLNEINTSKGLLSNAIKNLNIDQANNIWSAMQEGISYIEYGSPWEKYHVDNVSGDIIAIGKLCDQLYIGSAEGLYHYDNEINQFLPSATIKSRVWSLAMDSITQSKVMIGSTSQGVFKIDDRKTVQKIFHHTFIYKFYRFGNQYLAFHSDGVSILNEKMIEEDNIELTENTFVDIESDMNHSVWASSKFKGIYEIRDLDRKDQKIVFYNEDNGLPDVSEIYMIQFNKKLLFTTTEGLYEYKPDNPDSIKFTPYHSHLNPKGHIKQAEKDQNGNFYFTIAKKDGDQLEKYEKQPDNTFKRIYKPFLRLPDMEITAIYPDKDGVLWVAGSEGVFRYDAKIKKEYDLPFNTLINDVTVNDSLIFGGFYQGFSDNNEVPYLTIDQPEDERPVLTYKKNNVTFEFAAAFYEAPEKNEFSYRLQNNDERWSAWSNSTRKEYTNLAPGDYTFFVKSKNIYDTEGRVGTYAFTILPPWYKTTLAYIFFGILIILFIWFIALTYSYRIRAQRRKLKLIVADRTFKVLHQKKEIEAQNAQLKTQNDEIIKQRDEITTKNDKLQKFQEEILKVNNKLKELNYSLEMKVEERTAKIKSTLQQLQQLNKELDTFVYRASHDLKGPISRIQGLTTLAKLEVPDDKKKYYDLIELTALNMRGLLSKLSNTYEIMNKEVTKEEIDIPFLLSEIRNTMKFLDQDTQYHFDIQDKFTIVSDRYLVKIIFENLIENALIFKRRSSEGHKVRVKCYEKDHCFHFQITDNGIGIRPEHLEKVYEMFFRGSDQSKGSGLGLYIIKMALVKIQGEISVCSELYESSTFTVKIPLIA